MTSIPRRSFLPTRPLNDALPVSQPDSTQTLRRRLSSISFKIQPISSPVTSWSFHRSKSVSSLRDHTGKSLRKWWDWGWSWILSRKAAFARDLEMNDEETKSLRSNCRGSFRHLFYKGRSYSNIGINVAPAASSVVAKTALSDTHVQSQSSSSVPGSDAYREWEVKVFDWQTQCPTLAGPEQPSFMYKTIKLLPTVGCEADAATRYSVDERNFGSGANEEVNAFAYQRSGCYVAVQPIEDGSSNKLLELEHCLVNPQDRESRARIVQKWRTAWWMRHRSSAFASTAALKASEVVGTWQGPVSVARLDGSQIAQYNSISC
ncbi:hypothetical protein SDJN03_17625, partial [Cucurbita argyrosperma subsp. sororia]